jgi:DNA end-binding protein Ku
MAARPTWQGHLRLSLVTCPVALYTATSRAGDISFNLINPKTNNRIRMVVTDPETGPVERSSLVKGYEVEKDRYIILTEDEIKSVRLETTRTIDIERFVDASEIDRLYWNDPYYLTPDGKIAAEAFAVIREAMSQTGKIALGRVVLHTRERLLALEPRDNGIVAYSLRTHDEVRDPAGYFAEIPTVKVDKNMLAIAEKIIEQQAGDFDPATFVDHYEEALKAMIAQKEQGQKPTRAETPKDTQVSDLMEALRQSLAGAPAVRKPATRGVIAKPATTRRKPVTRRRAS